MVNKMKNSKKSTKTKKTDKDAGDQIIDYDVPVKPDDQLILSLEVRISNFTCL